jgi:hypothetical protein
VGTNPNSLTTGDFNGDGSLDLAVANVNSSDVSVLLGNGNGTFKNQVRFGTGINPSGIVAGDFNHDGHLDLATSDLTSNDVAVLLGMGNGMFPTQVRYAAGQQPRALLAGDFNRDGGLDIAVANGGSNSVGVLLNQGQGTFPNPFRVIAGQSFALARGDVNGDGIADLVTANSASNDVAVFLGVGDGTFHNPVRYAVGLDPLAIVLQDFNDDGHLDLAVANDGSNDVSILLNNGDGTFQAQLRDPVGSAPIGLAAGDLNGDGQVDLVTANNGGGDISVLLGLGNGAFTSQQQYAVGTAPIALALADFNQDGHADVAVTNGGSNTVSVLLGNGDGTLAPPVFYDAGSRPAALVTGDFNGDGRLDLAVANSDSNDVWILQGNGDGTFTNQLPNRPPMRYVVDTRPRSLAAGDFNGDGRLDLATANTNTGDVSVLLGNGNGTFQSQLQFAVDAGPVSLVTGDFNGDGQVDLATANSGAADLSVLLGVGDGTFANPVQNGVGSSPFYVVTGDFNGDGIPDLASANSRSNNVSILLGNGDGTFQTQTQYAVGTQPQALAVADFNGDGRLDLVVVNVASNDISILLGIGNGKFQVQAPIRVMGNRPVGAVVGDFNGDGIVDVALVDRDSNNVTVLLGKGNGTFRPGVQFAVDSGPDGIAVGDLNHDGRLDLVTVSVDLSSNDASVLLGNGNGTFQAAVNYALPGPAGAIASPRAVVVGDFNGDGIPDLATANAGTSFNNVALLLGNGNGTFQLPTNSTYFPVGTSPNALIVGDINGDGRLDLATANGKSNDVSLLLGNGNGTFQSQLRFPVGSSSLALTVGDFNIDGNADLAVVNNNAANLAILLGNGQGSLVPAGALAETVRSTPLVADFNGDGISDVAVLDQAGQILVRLGQGQGMFSPPIVVNPDPQRAARDVTFFVQNGVPDLAALDAKDTTVSLYTVRRDGTPTRVAGPVVPGILPARIVAGDLNGDGRADLVVAASGSHILFVYPQNAAGSFGPQPELALPVGGSPSDIALADVNGDGKLDIVVTDRVSGTLSVFLNESVGPFASSLHFRAGTGLYGLASLNGTSSIVSGTGTAAVVPGEFGRRNFSDLIVLNSTADSFSVLQGDGAGGFFNPQSALTYRTGSLPMGVAVGDFNGDGNLDLAVLNEQSDSISICLGDALGHFRQVSTAPTGNAPTGISVADVNRDGKLDLLVGDRFGDILLYPGNGDGTFQTFQRADNMIGLAVGDLTGDGRPDFIFSNQSKDQVTLQLGNAGSNVFQNRQDGILAPGAVRLADLNGDGLLDLIVVNSGGNDILVYLGTGPGEFNTRPRTFFTGTDPVRIALQDLNGDGLPDLAVADEGSNDVSILLSQGRGSSWTLTNGPRLRAGEGPAAVTFQDVTGDGVPDLIVTNSQSNDVYVLHSVGNGFFNDQAPAVLPVGIDPVASVVGDFNGDGQLDLATINFGSNDITIYSGFTERTDISFGGSRPIGVFAGDFNGDGATDLVTVNNGNGLVDLLLGGPNGLTLTEALSDPGLAHASDVALSTLSGGVLRFYVTDEGKEIAFPFSVDFRTPVQRTDVESLSGSPGSFAAFLVSVPSEAAPELSDVATPPPLPAFVLAGESSGYAENPLVDEARQVSEVVLNQWLPVVTELALETCTGVNLLRQEAQEGVATLLTGHSFGYADFAPDLHLQETVAAVTDALLHGGRAAAGGIVFQWRFQMPGEGRPGAANEPMDEETSIILPGEGEDTPTGERILSQGGEEGLVANVPSLVVPLLSGAMAERQPSHSGALGFTLVLSGLSPGAQPGAPADRAVGRGRRSRGRPAGSGLDRG